MSLLRTYSSSNIRHSSVNSPMLGRSWSCNDLSQTAKPKRVHQQYQSTYFPSAYVRDFGIYSDYFYHSEHFNGPYYSQYKSYPTKYRYNDYWSYPATYWASYKNYITDYGLPFHRSRNHDSIYYNHLRYGTYYSPYQHHIY
ncbi:unnamed protein product [Bursaphelenchus xylophilus]|uniref:(pine wood nematode) hypothetical protein n=1 Tax=Bursaphelenchus xylophilus TaxID=6326 RepID=A0A1I7STC0_BURXY|nr:unnamed protein product [Bursaphelenchus xylophilus]CAG9108581.1 unnamed protein product [Bursaphelenchus xylophilus]